MQVRSVRVKNHFVNKTWIVQFQREYLLVIFKIIIFNFDFVYEKPNSKGIGKEIHLQ